MTDVGWYGPLATVAVGFLGACIAGYSIFTQRAIARKRAAIDVFLKTETDEKMIKAWAAFVEGVVALKDNSEDLSDFAETVCYRNIRSYLNIHELIAVGISTGVFDEEVCFAYWSQVLVKACDAASAVIQYARSFDGQKDSYSDLVKLRDKWSKRLNCR